MIFRLHLKIRFIAKTYVFSRNRVTNMKITCQPQFFFPIELMPLTSCLLSELFLFLVLQLFLLFHVLTIILYRHLKFQHGI